MKKFLTTCLPFLSFLVLAVACSPKPKAPETTQIKFSEPFLLGVSQTALNSTDNLKVTLTGITEDSRCPEGLECMWAGQVTANVIVATADGSQKLVFTIEGKNNKASSTQTFQGYKFRMLDVTPYPKSGETIEKHSYQVKLIVVK